MATIYIIKGPNSGGIFSLTADDCVLGRSEKCSITLEDDRVSGSHVRISFDPKKSVHTAEDTKSTNGTWINGRSMTLPVVLKNGDKLEIGSSVIEFHSSSFDSIEEAKAALHQTSFTASPTMMENQNRNF